MTSSRAARALLAVGACALLAGACAADESTDEGGGSTTSSGTPAAQTIVLVTHDSFALTPALLEAFTEETGITVELQPSGDAGAMLNRAILTKDDPEGDVLFGVDTNLLGRALENDLFLPYESELLEHVPDALEVNEHVTPIDRGDVCLNYDRAYFAVEGLAPPDDFDDLIDPAYRGLTVVEDPSTSSPGLAFLFGTVARFDDGWEAWWTALRDNDVLVESGWESAYYGAFSGGSGEGDRPIVVSYASSPAAEVHFAEEPMTEAPTGVVTSTCVAQVEYAGVLAGTEHAAAAQQLVDFLLSEEVQADIPLQMFVYPVRDDVALPEVFVDHAAAVDEPLRVPLDDVERRREELIERWGELVLR